MNIVFDIINLVFTAWLKPMLAMALLIYIVNKPDFRSAAANHWLLFLALLSPVFFILLFSFLPRIEFAVLPDFLASLTAAQVFHPTLSTFEAPNIYSVALLAIYLSGVLVCFAQIARAIWETLRLVKQADTVNDEWVKKHCADLQQLFGVKKSFQVLSTNKISAPLMFGFVRPCILLPRHFATWGTERLYRVLAHEIAHIERNDCFYKLCGEVMCALFWFNPLMWKANKQGAWFAELACDDLVVSKLKCRAEYAGDLLELSTDACHHKLAALSFIKKSELYLRINAILDGGKNRNALDCLSRSVLSVLVLFLLLPISILEAKQSRYKSISVMELEALQAQSNVNIRDLIIVDSRDNDISTLPGYIKLEELKARYKRENQEILLKSKSPKTTTQLASLKLQEPLAVKNTVTPKSHLQFGNQEIEAYRPIEIVTPTYPRRALQKNLEAIVVVSFDVDIQGQVQNAEVVSIDHSPVFNRPVLKAITQSKYQPMTINGHPIITRNVKETFVFTLRDTADTH